MENEDKRVNLASLNLDGMMYSEIW